MLKIPSAKREPYWLDASHIGEGARIQVAPITPAMILVARDAATRVILAVAGSTTAETASDDSILAGAEGQAAFTRALAQRGILAMEGFGDQDGTPVEASAEVIDNLLADFTLFEFIDLKYVGPELSRLREKNASSPSQSGISRVVMRTAKTAGKSPAKRVRRARTS